MSEAGSDRTALFRAALALLIVMADSKRGGDEVIPSWKAPL